MILVNSSMTRGLLETFMYNRKTVPCMIIFHDGGLKGNQNGGKSVG